MAFTSAVTELQNKAWQIISSLTRKNFQQIHIFPKDLVKTQIKLDIVAWPACLQLLSLATVRYFIQEKLIMVATKRLGATSVY